MRRPFVPVLLALSCLSAAGCKVTQTDIDTWTGTQKGPGKIVAVLLADKYEDELRSYAGIALVRMEPRAPTPTQLGVDGVSELVAALRQLPEASRTGLVDRMAPELLGMMRGEDSATEQRLSREQVRAKDAAFLLLPYASPERSQEMSNAVVDWFVADFNGRAVEGNYTAEQVARQLGAPAAVRLLPAINAQLPSPALVKVAELIATVGDTETKGRAATRLVEVEQEMETEEFLTALTTRLRNQLEQQMERGERPRSEIDDARLREAAEFNRDQFINIGTLPAMKHLNGQRAVQDRLLVIAAHEGPGEMNDRQRQALEDRRTRALQALEGGARPDQVEALLDLALNPNTPVRVRDYAFDRVTDLRARSALARLWPQFEQRPHPDWRLRWRVGTIILGIGGTEVVREFFDRLGDEPYAREELYGYGVKISEMSPPPNDFMDGQLRSPHWYVRAIALYFWEKRATAEDLPRITALETDEAATRGDNWRDHTNVGLVAQAVAGVVRERLAGPARPSVEGGGDGGSDGSGNGGQAGSGESGSEPGSE